MKFAISSSVSRLALGAALFIAPAIVGGHARAAAIIGSNSIITIDGVSSSGGMGDLLTATSFTFGATSWGAGQGDFAAIPVGTAVTPSDLMVNSLGAFSFTSAAGNFAATQSLVIGSKTFTSAIVSSSGSIAAGSESLTMYIVGLFTPAGVLANFYPSLAGETISFTETGISASSPGSFSVSATFASPPSGFPLIVPPPTNSITIDVPEPASMVSLGAGLVALGVFRRRKG